MWTLRWVFCFSFSFLLLGLFFFCVYVCLRSLFCLPLFFFLFGNSWISYSNHMIVSGRYIDIIAPNDISHSWHSSLILWISSEIGRIHFYMIYLISVHGLVFFVVLLSIFFVKSQQFSAQKISCNVIFFLCVYFLSLLLIRKFDIDPQH